VTISSRFNVTLLRASVSSMRSLAPALLLLVLTGCSGGDGSPTAPTAPPVPTFQLMGRVVDASAGINLAGVTLSALDGVNANKKTVTAADGRYTLVNLLSGSFTLRAQREGYEDHVQAITITTHTTIDMRMTPGRSVSSGWAGGQFFVSFNGERTGARVTTAQVTQNGSTLSGQFTGSDGSNGTFVGQLAGTRFTGSMRVEIISGTRRCRGNAANVTGTATGDSVALTAAVVTMEDCSASVTDLALTLTP
jgi:hypothetical protein